MSFSSICPIKSVHSLATRFNLGGELSEEILKRAGIDKNLDARECTDLIGQIDEKIQNLQNQVDYEKMMPISNCASLARMEIRI